MLSTVVSQRYRGELSLLAQAAVAAIAVTTLAVLASPAGAQSPRPKAAAPAKAAPPALQSQGPLIAVVSTGSQRVTFYDRNGVVVSSPVSTGRSGFETPHGVFSIIERKEEHFSNIYDDAPMPFMQRITWSGVALHAGSLPGYPASHGCIRLPHSFAERLFKLTKINTRVIIVGRDAAPMPIVHAALFQPRLPDATPVAVAPVEGPSAPPPQTRPPLPFNPVDGAETPMMLGARLPRPEMPEPAVTPMQPQRAITNVLEAARLHKAATALKAQAAVKVADDAKLVVRTKLVEAQKAERGIKTSDVLLRRAQGRVTAADRAITLARTEVAVEKAKALHAAALADLETLTKSVDDMKATVLTKAAEAQHAADAAKLAEQARVSAVTEAREAARRTEPISVLISRRTGRLYVRQDRQPVFDVPVTIKDPARPIGTHVFTAIDALPGGSGVRWNVVNVESPAAPAPAPQTTRRDRTAQPAAPQPSSPALGALALDRIVFPEEVLARITPYLQVGSSLIISDLGLSIETGKGTDFVIQTRGEEQAAANIAKFVAEQREQRRNGTAPRRN